MNGEILKMYRNQKEIERNKKCEEYNLPSYTVLEEVLNSVTHGIGAIFAITAIVLLIVEVPKNFENIFYLSIYGGALFVLYIISTLYHSLKLGFAKKVFRVLDHCSIFLAIAGTYTPICALIIGGRAGAILLSFIWFMAIIGIILNSISLNKFAKLSMTCYMGMGWGVLFAMKWLLESVTYYQLLMLIMGGVAYTLGAVLYGIGKKFRYVHSIWHIFVLAGSVLHFFMIYNFTVNM